MMNAKFKTTMAAMTLVWLGLGLMSTALAQVPAAGRRPPVPSTGERQVGAVVAEGLLGDRRADATAIKHVTEAFTQAFNSGDARAVAALYTDDAELIDEYGERVQGRRLIQDFYDALFSERKGATIDVSVSSLRFLGPDVAREEGLTRVKSAGNEPALARKYEVLYVKQAGQWLHSSVREEYPTGLAHHEHLKELDWLTGEWVDETSHSVIQASCRWSDDRNFLLRDFVIHVQGKPVMNVSQRIGWDPLSQQIKSWVFDSDGGYGQSLWARSGNRWTIKSTGVVPDGRIATATHVLTRTGPNTARWTTKERTLGGEPLADHPESVLVRRPPQPQPQTEPRRR
jgi:uncharacterized protein (TIGR02246 family)